MKITDMIVSALIKKGVLYEVRNCDITIDIPINNEKITVNVKADHMKLTIDSDSHKKHDV